MSPKDAGVLEPACGILGRDVAGDEGLVVDERAQPEVVDDQQIGGGEAQQLAVVGLIGAGHAELGEHVVGGDVEDWWPMRQAR